MKLPRGAVVLIVVGVIGVLACVGGFALADSVDGRIAGYPAVEAGSSGNVDLDAGKQTGWFESSCFGCEGRESTVAAPELRVEGADVSPHGDHRSARYSPGDFLNYSDGPREGGPAYEIDVPEAGSYAVTVGPSSEPDALIRFGPNTDARKVGGIALAIVGFLLAGGALFVLAAWWISVMLRDATRNG